MRSDQSLPHTSEDTAEVLRRAQEIDQQKELMLEPYPEYTELIRAAEEAGIGRDATLQALRERMSLPAQAFEPGQRVFAKSADGHYYAARIERIEGPTAFIKFVNGSEHAADVTDLRMFSLTPGLRVGFHSPDYGVWLQAEVVRFNAESGSVTVNAWTEEETVPLEKIRLNKQGGAAGISLRDRLWFIVLSTAAAAGAIGAGITLLLNR